MTAQDRLRAARGFVLDVDGTLVLGTRDGGVHREIGSLGLCQPVAQVHRREIL